MLALCESTQGGVRPRDEGLPFWAEGKITGCADVRQGPGLVAWTS